MNAALRVSPARRAAETTTVLCELEATRMLIDQELVDAHQDRARRRFGSARSAA